MSATYGYISGTLDYGLHFRTFGNDGTIRADCDSNLAGDIETTRSTTEFIVRISGTPIYWRRKRETIVALSSGEAEYITLSTYAKVFRGCSLYGLRFNISLHFSLTSAW